jgi:sec-independent protein translocase protein TatA
MPFKLGPLEIGLILVIIVVIFGVGKLPQVGSAIGKSIRAFKEGQTVEEEEETKSKKITKKKKKVVKKPAATEEKPVTPETMGTPGNN